MYFGASSIQVDYDGSFLKNHRQSEDCLTLNIFTENINTKKKKPVIVIFHHGDFSYGGSADPILYNDDWKKIYPDTVIVTFNFRPGILGFIDFSKIHGGEDYPDALNIGLLDQIAASENAKGFFQKTLIFLGNPLASYETPEVSKTFSERRYRLERISASAYRFRKNFQM